MSGNGCSTGRLAMTLAVGLFFAAGISGCPWDGRALADPGTAQTGEKSDGKYHTPLAGKARHTSFLGYPVYIPAFDRGNMTSLTLGATLQQPKQGETHALPIAALYLRRVEDDWRTRDTVSIFVNDLEYDRRFGRFELVTQFENYTLPETQTELRHNREVKSTSAMWGSGLAALGPGLRIPVAPFQVDNDLRVQLVGRAGFFYAGRTDETGANLVLPPDTFLYGARLRGRYDGLRRNVLELPHLGFAAGFEADYLVRDRWHDVGFAGSAPPSGNRDYLHATGYLVGASGIPGLSERNRVLLSAYGGATVNGRGDRFNAFRINGGPFPSEADDLPRPHYTGTIFDDILATDYAIASLGYRRELTFFLYLTLYGSYLWAERSAPLDDGRVSFRQATAVSGTATLDCAFLWNSALYFAYSWDSGAIRNGRSGSGFLVTWNKLF